MGVGVGMGVGVDVDARVCICDTIICAMFNFVFACVTQQYNNICKIYILCLHV